MIKAIIFDLDNTLTHRNKSIEQYAEAFVEDFQAQLTSISKEEIAALIKGIDNNGYGNPTNTHSSQKMSIAYALSQLPQWQTPVSFYVLLNHWMHNFPLHSVAIPEAKELLTLLKHQGYRLGVISNGAAFSRLATLNALGFLQDFEVVISSDEFGTKKPDASIFIHTAQQMGLAPEDCCYIGDHYTNDYLGATRSGMTAYWLEGFIPLPSGVSKPDNTLTNLDDLKQIFLT
ncbi:HAD family hydrolase [Parendozoicomonas haliclonae]|uniref:Phosphoglycolate phosphatase n=1 Tax=Parendozoicomonas haliclonae TaxID=1960125 RepID=A0A1X7AKB4_9GAMM|nr:HAD family hydrolase [Parendozoicomonas haliclonae]SMA47685.1 Phosphoglycolate phosphatase [Parendozoicomonas haliclonae]